jgi:hypothetical protein
MCFGFSCVFVCVVIISSVCLCVMMSVMSNELKIEKGSRDYDEKYKNEWLPLRFIEKVKKV